MAELVQPMSERDIALSQKTTPAAVICRALVGKLNDCDPVNQLGKSFESLVVRAEMPEIPNQSDLGFGKLLNESNGLVQAIQESPA